MFEPSSKPRLFGMPIGADFSRCLADEVLETLKDKPPEDLARVEIFVNTARMRRSLTEAFLNGRALLLPRIRLITELANDAILEEDAEQVSDLRTKLELTQLVRALLEKEKTRAPAAALFDLSESLYQLADEMHGEGVDPDDVVQLDVSDQSGYWQQSLEFIKILKPFFETGQGSSARLREVVKQKIECWEKTPPNHPIIVAGSTGSRGATRMFMEAVSTLPQGALVLPGFDFDLPATTWAKLEQEDHPQFRFKALLDRLSIDPTDVAPWPGAVSANPARDKLLSLALRPAPVTNEWIEEGAHLGHLPDATENLSLIEADSPRQEAEAIALRMRKALDQGLKCALISPDRMLTRQVAAALDRWDLVADDSAGTPLPLSAPGRLLNHLAEWTGQDIPAHVLLTLLMHPLCHSTETERGDHLLWTREVELHLRRYGPPIPDRRSLAKWAEKQGGEKTLTWAHWIADFLEDNASAQPPELVPLLDRLIARAERFCAGTSVEGSGGLWLEAAGREAKAKCQTLQMHGDAAGPISISDFVSIFKGVLADGVVRDRDLGHPDLLILGTLESRVQSADLVVLGGLNEGSWPEESSPDPWLNRSMRKSLGLLLPERQIGLSAHDFQQAVGAKEVWLTRSKRSADSETVPSRWLNRLTNLMDGLPRQGGPDAIHAMKARGETWKTWASSLSIPEEKVRPAPRPSPCPPAAARPRDLSVTQIKTLIRDPFAIYARKTLRLKPLDPLVMEADAPLKGEIFHRILERFIRSDPDVAAPSAIDDLINIAKEELEEKCPWPAMQLRWLTQFEALAPSFIADEIKRQGTGTVAGLELRGALDLPSLDFQLKGVADRIDVNDAGEVLIYDYKTGVVPTVKQQEHYDKQLLLEAAMVLNGGFKEIPPSHVANAAFISVNPEMKITLAPLSKAPPELVWEDFIKLITRWSDPTLGYTARMAMVSKTDHSQYDHLSRFGEWDLGSTPKKVVLS